MPIRQRKRGATKLVPLTHIPTVPVPLGLLKTIVDRCHQTIQYGDNKADKVIPERADAADFYRRAAEIAVSELTKIINKGV